MSNISENVRIIIGECEVDKNGHVMRIDRGWFRQGYIYKNPETYYTDKTAVCYVPELSDTAYTGEDILDICNGQPEIADRAFEMVDWQHPETYLDEQWVNEELKKCSCGKWYWYHDVDKCPYCGATKRPDPENSGS